MNIRIGVQNLGSLPGAQMMIVCVPKHPLLRSSGSCTSGDRNRGPITGHGAGSWVVDPGEGGAEFVEADVQVGSKTGRAQAVHGEFEGKAGSRSPGAPELGTVQQTIGTHRVLESRGFPCQVGSLQESVTTTMMQLFSLEFMTDLASAKFGISYEPSFGSAGGGINARSTKPIGS